MGLSLANWMTDGDPGFDIWAMDVARFGDYATLAYTSAKVQGELLSPVPHPVPQRGTAGRTPAGDLAAARPLVAENAVWGDAFGLESALWFQRPGLEPAEDVTFGRSNAWAPVRDEVLAVRNGVGLMETTGFSKFLFEGPGARSFLDSIITNRTPKRAAWCWPRWSTRAASSSAT